MSTSKTGRKVCQEKDAASVLYEVKETVIHKDSILSPSLLYCFRRGVTSSEKNLSWNPVIQDG